MNQKNQVLKILTLIHFAILAGMVLFFGIVLLKKRAVLQSEISLDFQNPFAIVVLTLLVFVLFLHNFMFKQQLEKAKKAPNFPEKIKQYQTALIIKWALIEAPIILAITATLITGNIIFLGIAALLIIYLYTLKPNKEKLFSDLELSREERQQF